MLKGKTVLGNRYQIVKTLGKGGMGAVYLAEDQRLPTKWAVKAMMRDSLSPKEVAEATELFRTEARLLSELRHRNLPRIVDFFDEDSELYLVMDYVEGETLETRIERDGPLTLNLALELSLQISDVLDYLHTRPEPVIFRDFKPGNVMLTAQNEVKLIDFGIARVFRKDKSSDTRALGTPGYAAPEQYGKGQSGPQTDLYAFAATMHHALSGRDPTDEPFNFPPLFSYRQDLPQALISLFESCLALQASERPESAFAVKRQLEQIIRGQSNSSTLSGRASTQELAEKQDAKTATSSTTPLATAAPTQSSLSLEQAAPKPEAVTIDDKSPQALKQSLPDDKAGNSTEIKEAKVIFKPSALDFKQVASGHKASARLRVKTSQAVTLISSSSNLLIEPTDIAPGTTNVTITLDARDLGPNSKFKAEVDLKELKLQKVPVEADIIASDAPMSRVIGSIGLALLSMIPILGYLFTGAMFIYYLRSPVPHRKSLRLPYFFSVLCSGFWTAAAGAWFGLSQIFLMHR